MNIKTIIMQKRSLVFFFGCFFFFSAIAQQKETLIFHPVKTDKKGNILPWYNANSGTSYSHIIKLVWNFWDTMRHDMNGLPYYMNHQVWKPFFNDPRGIGGDQLAMALSSWRLYYAFSGNERVKANMNFIADYYLTHSLSPSDCKWPDIPFPYNTYVYSGVYDGDMTSGKDITQPDKAGSFALELVHLYKITENKLYLNAAEKIANTLASHMQEGNINYSPLPFKINVHTGEIPVLRGREATGTWIDTAGYTSNWAPAMQLFLDLAALNEANASAYKSGFRSLLMWMKAYPMKQNKWGPFFEDVDWWSETQMNAMTFARFIMEHREYFPDWKMDVNRIFEWVHKNFSNVKWIKYGVTVTNEQSVYAAPGNSHSSRQAADELLYVKLSGDSTLYENAVRALNWATYMVDVDGKNRYPQDEPWLTDGYGDYVRHYLRAMDAVPALTPPNEDHIISSTSVIQQADYDSNIDKFVYKPFENVDIKKIKLFYRTFDTVGVEKIRLKKKPSSILLDYRKMTEATSGEGYEWQPMQGGGLLTIRRMNGKKVLLMK
jgi:hypothetical protein